MNAKVALITGILRDAMASDPWGTLEQVAAMGYMGIETGSGLMKSTGMTAAQVKQRLNDMGLQTFSFGSVLHPGNSDLQSVIDDALALGCKYVVTFWAPCESREQVLTYAEYFNKVGAKLKDNGLTFCYHNHDHEFKGVFDGEHGIDILFNATDPDLVKAEIDVAWVRFGGADPATHIRKFENRCPLIHIKDIYTDEFRGAWTEVGTGIVDIKGSFEAGLKYGADWFIVEQDQPRDLAPMDSIRVSIENIHKLGYGK